jgi:hypothetical protein
VVTVPSPNIESDLIRGDRARGRFDLTTDSIIASLAVGVGVLSLSFVLFSVSIPKKLVAGFGSSADTSYPIRSKSIVGVGRKRERKSFRRSYTRRRRSSCGRLGGDVKPTER